MRQRWTSEGAAARVVAAGTMFDHNTLTIGFARRFTGYKRPELIFSDADRLARILTAPGRPVQIVFAGKAHPADDIGKHHLQRIYRRALDPKFGGRIAFVDDYDLHVAHFLVQGCDVWLNNPRKPLEASGTSGMKAAINGTPHLSIGDGWWAEGFTGDNGWLIEGHADPSDQGAQDWADAQALYALLEEQIVPAFYDRDADGIPRRWLQIVQAVDPDGAPPLQRAADGEGIRPDNVRAGAAAAGRRPAADGRRLRTSSALAGLIVDRQHAERARLGGAGLVVRGAVVRDAAVRNAVVRRRVSVRSSPAVSVDFAAVAGLAAPALAMAVRAGAAAAYTPGGASAIEVLGVTAPHCTDTVSDAAPLGTLSVHDRTTCTLTLIPAAGVCAAAPATVRTTSAAPPPKVCGAESSERSRWRVWTADHRALKN